MHVLILGARAPAALEWMRAFHAAGWQVTAADSLNWPIGRTSQMAQHYLRLPQPRGNCAAWIDTLSRESELRAIDLILPTCEEVFYLGQALDRLPCRAITVPAPLLNQLHHKYRFACFSKKLSIKTPESHLLRNAGEVRRFASSAADWVFKPAYSRFAEQVLVRPTAAQLVTIHPSNSQPWVAQRFVAGREHCSYSILCCGRLAAHACYQPRYRFGAGAGIWFAPTNPAPIRKFVESFGQATGYNGQVAFDFIETAEGHFAVLECNPRATSGVHLFDDQPAQLVAALLGEQQETVLQPTQHPRMLALAMLLFCAPRLGWHRSFWCDIVAARDVIVRPGDWRPLLSQPLSLLEIACRALRWRCGMRTASTADIAWNGEGMEEPRS